MSRAVVSETAWWQGSSAAGRQGNPSGTCERTQEARSVAGSTESERRVRRSASGTSGEQGSRAARPPTGRFLWGVSYGAFPTGPEAFRHRGGDERFSHRGHEGGPGRRGDRSGRGACASAGREPVQSVRLGAVLQAQWRWHPGQGKDGSARRAATGSRRREEEHGAGSGAAATGARLPPQRALRRASRPAGRSPHSRAGCPRWTPPARRARRGCPRPPGASRGTRGGA